MNIAVLSFHRLGGSGIIAHEIAHEMARRYNHVIHFVGLEPPYRMDKVSQECTQRIYFHKVTMKNYPVFDFQPYVMALASQLSQLIIEYNIDVIHSHYAIPHALAANLAKQIAGREEVRTIVTLHGTDVTIVGSDASMMPITAYSILQNDAIVAVSEYLRGVTVEKLNIPSARIHVIPNFINSERVPVNVSPALQQAKPRPAKRLLLHSSNLRPVKAPIVVIEIFAKLLVLARTAGVELGELELGIIGEGPEKKKMETRANILGIGRHVQFLGERMDIYEHLSKAELFLLPSRGEAFGLAALEAMACGVPVIATRLGGIPELIDHEVTGFLFAAGDVDAAARYAFLLLTDAEMYARMSYNAWQAAREKFPMNKALKAYQQLYETAIQKVPDPLACPIP